MVKYRSNKNLVSAIKGGLPAGILGIGEPLIYGVSLPLGRIFPLACLGGAVGGAVMGFFTQGSVAVNVSGILGVLVNISRLYTSQAMQSQLSQALPSSTSWAPSRARSMPSRGMTSIRTNPFMAHRQAFLASLWKGPGSPGSFPLALPQRSTKMSCAGIYQQCGCHR